MNDQTPRVPELWWSPTQGLWRPAGGRVYGYTEVEYPHSLLASPPADAVRLVPEAASETEWGWCPDPDEPGMVLAAVDEAAARERVNAARIRVLMRRTVAIGPWTVVES